MGAPRLGRRASPLVAAARRGLQLLGALLAAAAGACGACAVGPLASGPGGAPVFRLPRPANAPTRQSGGGAGAAAEAAGSQPESTGSRRSSMLSLVGAGLACACAVCGGARRARALAPLRDASGNVKKPTTIQQGQEPGNKEQQINNQTKRALFSRMIRGLPRGRDAVIVEVGMGEFADSVHLDDAWDVSMDIIGIDPNIEDHPRAIQSAQRAGLLSRSNVTVRTVEGVAEDLPLESESADAVVFTFTLCTVNDPEKAVAEARRVLRPGGQMAFLEHVLSEDDPAMAEQQAVASRNVGSRACHLDRPTLRTIEAAGFKKVDSAKFELKNAGLRSPHIVGIAYA